MSCSISLIDSRGFAKGIWYVFLSPNSGVECAASRKGANSGDACFEE